MIGKSIFMADGSIIVTGNVKIFLRFGNKRKKVKKSRIKELEGILGDYKDKYTSVELQRKGVEWRANVSN